MRIYIASSLSNANLCAVVSELLEGEGHVITQKWWEEEALDPTMCKDDKLNLLAKHGSLDTIGIIKADLVVAILPGGRGTHMEIGIGLGCAIEHVRLCCGKSDHCKAVMIIGTHEDLNYPYPCSLYYNEYWVKPIIHEVPELHPTAVIEKVMAYCKEQT